MTVRCETHVVAEDSRSWTAGLHAVFHVEAGLEGELEVDGNVDGETDEDDQN